MLQSFSYNRQKSAEGYGDGVCHSVQRQSWDDGSSISDSRTIFKALTM